MHWIVAGLIDGLGPDELNVTGAGEPDTGAAGEAASSTGFGNEREYQSPAPPSVTATRTTIPAISPRDSDANRSPSEGMRER